MSQDPPGGARIAFFGGSFDPPHFGHLAIARAAQQALALDLVLFVPVGLQPLKPDGSSASFADRVAMTRLAIAHQIGFDLSLADAPRSFSQPAEPPSSDTPNYTIDTLNQLRQSLPQNAQLFLLLGADSFRTLRRWRRAAELPFLASLIVASRPGEDLTDLAASLPRGIALHPISGQPNQFRLSNSAGRQSQLTILPNLHYDISATQLRNRIQGRSANQPPLLDPAVLQYIHRRHLYEE